MQHVAIWSITYSPKQTNVTTLVLDWVQQITIELLIYFQDLTLASEFFILFLSF
jgi:hypothetical protein